MEEDRRKEGMLMTIMIVMMMMMVSSDTRPVLEWVWGRGKERMERDAEGWESEQKPDGEGDKNEHL